MSILSRLRRRRPTAIPADQDQRTLRTVDAPSSLPLPFEPLPDIDGLVADAADKATQLSDTGAADEFCGHVFDRYFDHWRTESKTGVCLHAGERRRVDRALIDEARDEADRAAARAALADARARDAAAVATAVWQAYLPDLPNRAANTDTTAPSAR
ncbi:hypothetical protein [Rhodococcus sp. YH1]|uniref:hypothetical protein n=1 Tax=Rhodococcus sp. YH1 TaxID=89066 RepID=UPI0013870544|nr:hypothetical protein [Rhodococcus sp. YH1]